MTELAFPTPFALVFKVRFGAETIVASEWGEPGDRPSPPAKRRATPLALTIGEQLAAYFTRKLDIFDLPFEFHGTPFTLAVWHAALRIPFGDTASYGDIARAAGSPGAHRGVARAMGQIEHALFIPAHRIIGADGRMKGAGPNSLRRRLLDFEASTS